MHTQIQSFLLSLILRAYLTYRLDELDHVHRPFPLVKAMYRAPESAMTHEALKGRSLPPFLQQTFPCSRHKSLVSLLLGAWQEDTSEVQECERASTYHSPESQLAQLARRTS